MGGGNDHPNGLWRVNLNNIRSLFWSPIGFQNKCGLFIKHFVVKRVAAKEILGWVTHWEVQRTSINKWYQSMDTCLTSELALWVNGKGLGRGQDN